MNTQTDSTSINPMQEIEAFPLEDRSLPAEEVIQAQQTSAAEMPGQMPTYVP